MVNLLQKPDGYEVITRQGGVSVSAENLSKVKGIPIKAIYYSGGGGGGGGSKSTPSRSSLTEQQRQAQLEKKRAEIQREKLSEIRQAGIDYTKTLRQGGTKQERIDALNKLRQAQATAEQRAGAKKVEAGLIEKYQYGSSQAKLSGRTPTSPEITKDTAKTYQKALAGEALTQTEVQKLRDAGARFEEVRQELPRSTEISREYVDDRGNVVRETQSGKAVIKGDALVYSGDIKETVGVEVPQKVTVGGGQTPRMYFPEDATIKNVVSAPAEMIGSVVKMTGDVGAWIGSNLPEKGLFSTTREETTNIMSLPYQTRGTSILVDGEFVAPEEKITTPERTTRWFTSSQGRIGGRAVGTLVPYYFIPYAFSTEQASRFAEETVGENYNPLKGGKEYIKKYPIEAGFLALGAGLKGIKYLKMKTRLAKYGKYVDSGRIEQKTYDVKSQLVSPGDIKESNIALKGAIVEGKVQKPKIVRKGSTTTKEFYPSLTEKGKVLEVRKGGITGKGSFTSAGNKFKEVINFDKGIVREIKLIGGEGEVILRKGNKVILSEGIKSKSIGTDIGLKKVGKAKLIIEGQQKEAIVYTEIGGKKIYTDLKGNIIYIDQPQVLSSFLGRGEVETRLYKGKDLKEGVAIFRAESSGYSDIVKSNPRKGKIEIGKKDIKRQIRQVIQYGDDGLELDKVIKGGKVSVRTISPKYERELIGGTSYQYRQIYINPESKSLKIIRKEQKELLKNFKKDTKLILRETTKGNTQILTNELSSESVLNIPSPRKYLSLKQAPSKQKQLPIIYEKTGEETFLVQGGINTKAQSIYSGLGKYERTDSIQLQSRINTNLQKDSLIEKTKQRELQLLKPLGKLGMETKTKQVQKQKEETVQKQKEETAQKQLLKSLTLLKTKQVQKQKLKTDQLQRFKQSTTQQTPKPPEKTSWIIPPKLKLKPTETLKKVATKIKEDGFEAFAFKKGEAVSIAKGSKKEVTKKLAKELVGTLRASGFIKEKRTGRKVLARQTGLLGFEFRESRTDPFKIVERKQKRLRRGTTGKQIQYFKRNKARKSNSWLI